MSEPVTAKVLLDMFTIRGIEGKLLTIVESIGLPERQEAAVKGLVRQAVWDDINSPITTMFMEGEYQKVYSLINQLTESKLGGSIEIVPKKSK